MFIPQTSSGTYYLPRYWIYRFPQERIMVIVLLHWSCVAQIDSRRKLGRGAVMQTFWTWSMHACTCMSWAILAATYSWIAHQLHIGILLGRCRNKVRFQIQDQFWIPQPRLHEACYLSFFVKPKNGLIWPVVAFLLVFLIKHRFLSSKSMF